MRVRLTAGLACACWLAAQSDTPRQVELLTRVREHMKARLQQVPDYTCLETVERAEQVAAGAKFKPVDTVRIEVAEVDGREMFARPGRKFDEANPRAFAKGGFMANGLFAMHAKALFVEDRARFTYAGEDEIGGHKLVRYDYQVPLPASGLAIEMGSRQA